MPNSISYKYATFHLSSRVLFRLTFHWICCRCHQKVSKNWCCCLLHLVINPISFSFVTVAVRWPAPVSALQLYRKSNKITTYFQLKLYEIISITSSDFKSMLHTVCLRWSPAWSRFSLSASHSVQPWVSLLCSLITHWMYLSVCLM